MKKHISLLIITTILMSLINSCKKSNDIIPKDYSTSIKNKTWWGELAYTGKTPEYYSVHFNTDNTLTWSQFAGDFSGHWMLDKKQLTITFDANSIQIHADISEDNNLVNISDNTAASEIKSGEITTTSSVTLDNSSWIGYTQAPTKILELNFKPGLQTTINLENSPIKTYTYIQSSLSSVIRVGTMFFAIVISGSKMKGSINNAVSTWQATRQ